MDLSNYPQSQKKLETRDQQLMIGNFLQWLDNQGYRVCEKPEEEAYPYHLPVHKTIDGWLADYFGIDLDILEQERLEILGHLGRGEMV